MQLSILYRQYIRKHSVPGRRATLHAGASGPRFEWVRAWSATDSVAGTWLYDHDRGGSASGRFVMWRR